MYHVVLFQPEIPANTGNIIRLCANTGAELHLIAPLGFTLEDKKLRRAGLDYHEFVTVKCYCSWTEFISLQQPQRIFACSTAGRINYTEVLFRSGDHLLFGAETRGLPPEIRGQFAPARVLRIPMVPHSRSLNLANSVAIVLYEAWRQEGFVLNIEVK